MSIPAAVASNTELGGLNLTPLRWGCMFKTAHSPVLATADGHWAPKAAIACLRLRGINCVPGAPFPRPGRGVRSGVDPNLLAGNATLREWPFRGSEGSGHPESGYSSRVQTVPALAPA